MNPWKPLLGLPAHVGGQEVGGPGKRQWPSLGLKSRTPSCSASQPVAVSNSGLPMIFLKTQMTQTQVSPQLPAAVPLEKMSCPCWSLKSRADPGRPLCSLWCS